MQNQKKCGTNRTTKTKQSSELSAQLRKQEAQIAKNVKRLDNQWQVYQTGKQVIEVQQQHCKTNVQLLDSIKGIIKHHLIYLFTKVEVEAACLN